MEIHVMNTFWRVSVVLIVFSFTVIATKAQNVLLNTGFETASTNLVYCPDYTGVILTNTSAANWTVIVGQNIATDSTNCLTLAFRTATNSPSSGTYEEPDFGYTYPGVNNSGSATTALSGSYALRTFGPFSNFCCTASGAYQTISSNSVQAVSNNTIWVLSGSGLNWSGDPMQSIGPGVVNFGILQIQFFDAATNFLGQIDSAQLGTNLAVNVWTNISVTGIAPDGTTQIRAYALHVGMSGALGSIFWDDLSLTNAGVAPPPPPIVTNEFGVVIQTGNRLCWPTVVNTSYRPQYSDDNVTWVNVIPTNAPQQLLPGDGTTNCIFATFHKFYRVLQTPATPASLLNPGFESGTTTQADNWVQFNNAQRSSTNDTLFTITVHSGGFSMQTFGPFLPDLDASGAYQGLATSAGQNWRLTGYCLNWQNDRLSGSNAFGRADIEFLDSTNGVIQTVPGPAFGQDTVFPLDTWQFFEVDGTAPAGTATVRVRVAHFGQVGQTGSVWWDDLTLSQPTGAQTTNTPTVAPAVQVCWPTSVPANATFYQVQTVTNLAFTTPVVSNVLSNRGFEADATNGAPDQTTATTGWSKNGGGTSSSPNATRTGTGAFRFAGSGGFVPVAWQTFPASAGQVWQMNGYGWHGTGGTLNGAAFALLKLVWHDSSGTNVLNPVAGDANLIGSAVTGTFAGIESVHMTSSSIQNTWQFLQAQGTAPTNAADVQMLMIFVPNGASGTIRFDDTSGFQVTSFEGWKNFGLVFPSTWNTNWVFDPIVTTQKYYRVTTP